ncbi:Threonine/homoserine efflux transporter RhtA [Marinospirillum celere]|uniref:Threonine/homoserine efflux transporter RhtA n=1 Tax=Marinospirillum celere TaxID=1122252 RepID=A0A1I1I9T6_9GAMM|nr:DMT family transporter [Marinospirillum celere]SFC32795.1 Threonine/homoserine efflux transporter RhtA [Marinospirillum celere]
MNLHTRPLRLEWLAYLLLILTTLFWGGNFVVGRAVHAEIPPLALAWWRWLVALLFILPFIVRPLWQARQIFISHWKLLSLMSLLGVTGFNTLVYLGLQSLPASNAILLLSACPVFILAFSWVLFGEKINQLQIAGMLVSLMGIIALVSKGSPLEVLNHLATGNGNLWVLSAVICWALYSALLRKRPTGLPGMAFFGLTVILGWLFLTPFYLYELLVLEQSLAFNTTSLLSIGYVAVFASIAAFLFWNKGVEILTPNRAGYFIHLIPVWGLLLASVFLGERLEAFHWLGVAFIFVGIWLATVLGRKQSG